MALVEPPPMALGGQPPPMALGGQNNEETKIFVGGLSRDTTTSGLRVYFERFGDIADCVVIKDRSTGAPRGFGFVTYASQTTAYRVVQHRHVIDGKEVEAKPAVPRDSEVLSRPMPGPGGLAGPPGFGAAPMPQVSASADAGSKKIFVGGLSHETSESDFVAYFGIYGQVVDCVIMCDPHTRKPRGFGFITYDSPDSVERACHNKFHELNGKRVEVKRAIPQDRMLAGEDGSGGQFGGDFFGRRPPNVGFGGYPGCGPPSSLAMGMGMGGMGMGGGMGGRGFGRPMPGREWTAGALAPGPGMDSLRQAQALMAANGARMGPGVSGPGDAGLASALSAANSVLNPAMAEPMAEAPPPAMGGSGGSTGMWSGGDGNFGSATTALNQGLRAGYGGSLDQPSQPQVSEPQHAAANGQQGPMTPDMLQGQLSMLAQQQQLLQSLQQQQMQLQMAQQQQTHQMHQMHRSSLQQSSLHQIATSVPLSAPMYSPAPPATSAAPTHTPAQNGPDAISQQLATMGLTPGGEAALASLPLPPSLASSSPAPPATSAPFGGAPPSSLGF